MGKRFRLRISRVIPSFQSCRSKDDAAVATGGAADLFEVKRKAVSQLQTSSRSKASQSFESEELSVHGSKQRDASSAFLWERDDHWHVLSRVDSSPRRKIDSDNMLKSTSEDDDDEGSETPESSHRSFSNFLPTLNPIFEPCDSSPAQRRRQLTAGSFAVVVKMSEDPYGDFRRSMMEMVAEKRIYDEGELEQLLRCFLSLNSQRHHAAVLRAFAAVWAAVFPGAAAATPAANFPHRTVGES
ncbi:unnamed protein product [Spirodela intermedia]|uniref:Transcription repressor n=1 Tax=Spirodela intermedia TaxID=51605 RepID=A0A7I8JX80_SPIIN|nr:unnamed protein product [Spirodela intermedia]